MCAFQAIWEENEHVPEEDPEWEDVEDEVELVDVIDEMQVNSAV